MKAELACVHASLVFTKSSASTAADASLTIELVEFGGSIVGNGI
jgi:hypothetical protein